MFSWFRKFQICILLRNPDTYNWKRTRCNLLVLVTLSPNICRNRKKGEGKNKKKDIDTAPIVTRLRVGAAIREIAGTEVDIGIGSADWRCTSTTIDPTRVTGSQIFTFHRVHTPIFISSVTGWPIVISEEWRPADAASSNLANSTNSNPLLSSPTATVPAIRVATIQPVHACTTTTCTAHRANVFPGQS